MPSAVVLTWARGLVATFCWLMSHVMGWIASQLAFAGQQRAVVFPASGMHVAPAPQQKLPGRPPGHCWRLGSGHVFPDCRSKRTWAGTDAAIVVAEHSSSPSPSSRAFRTSARAPAISVIASARMFGRRLLDSVLVFFLSWKISC